MDKIKILVMVILLHIITLVKLEKVASELIGLKLRLIKRESLLSPPYVGNMNYEQRLETCFNISKARADNLKFSATRNKTMLSSKVMIPFKNVGDYFMVKVGIGDPNQYIYLNLDIAISPLTWTQCQGRNYYVLQQYGKSYDPRKSHTYRKISHGNPICKYPIFRRKNGECIYNISYPNEGSAVGLAAYEKFLFMTLKSTTTHVNKVIFGCTIERNNINFGLGSGILAMNKSPESLITQLSSITGGRFSYCLFLNPKAKGYLRFGNDIIRGKGKVQTSPLAQHLYYPYAYALNLSDISLGNLRLKIHKDVFANTRRYAGFLIDTSTIISNIHRPAYIRIRKVLAYRFDKLKLKKTSISKLDLCYEMRLGLKFGQVLVPMTFHFQGGAKLKVALEKVFLLNKEKSCFCLALMPTDGPTILGAMQQHNTRFTYDINKATVSFSPEDCIASENE